MTETKPDSLKEYRSITSIMFEVDALIGGRCEYKDLLQLATKIYNGELETIGVKK